MRSSRATHLRKRHGLTLIELVIVVAVLAILAGFIVPRLGFVRNLAADAGNATIIADATTQAVFYNTAIGHYPGGEDSLLDTGGGVYAGLNPTLKGTLTAFDLSTDANAAKSIVGQIDPNATTFNLYSAPVVPSATPNSDFSTAVPVTLLAGKVAQVTVPVAADVTAKNTNYKIYLAAYGAAKLNATTGAPNDGTFLIALGYGTNSDINGKTGLAAPVLFDKNSAEYTRPILLLKLFPTGTVASFGVPAGSNATTSISLGYDASTIQAQQTKYTVDQNR